MGRAMTAKTNSLWVVASCAFGGPGLELDCFPTAVEWRV
jgi:hypothetical protein